MTTPDLSVIVVHHRGLGHLLEALDGIASGTRGISAEAVLVDNTGGADLSEALRRLPSVRRVSAGGNVGFAAGCRLGAENSRAPVLALVNDDAVVEPSALEKLAAAISAAPPDVSTVAGRLTDREGRRNDFSDGFLTFDGHAFAARVGLPLERLDVAESGEERLFASGGLMAVRRADFLDSGGFDDDYFAYLEDVDFGWRQWIFGRRIVAEPGAVARHRGGATGEALGVFARGFLYEKNAFATAFKNFDAGHFRALMPAILAAFLGRIAEMLATRNPGAAELARDPYAAASARRPAMASLFGIANVPAAARLDDPLTNAHLRALLWIHRHRESLAARRKAVQAKRRRSDAEIFAKFPLRLVPTYPGDAQFDSDFFGELWPAEPRLVRTALSEIFEGGIVTPQFTVVIPTYERPKTLTRVLDALAVQSDAPAFEVVVVDDGSSDETPDLLARHRAPYPFRSIAQDNAGPAAARNRGIEAARGSTILFLGDDTVPEPPLLAIHARAHAGAGNGDALAVLGYTTWPEERRVTPFLHHINEYGLQFGYGLIEDPESVPFNFFYTSNISLPRALLLEAELFDTTFPNAAWEDIEIAYRLTRRGMRIVYRPEAVARHHHDISFESFRLRQASSGESAAVFYEKHPELGGFLGVREAEAFSDTETPASRLRAFWASLAERWELPGGRRAVDRVLREDYLRGLKRGLAAARGLYPSAGTR